MKILIGALIVALLALAFFTWRSKGADMDKVNTYARLNDSLKSAGRVRDSLDRIRDTILAAKAAILKNQNDSLVKLSIVHLGQLKSARTRAESLSDELTDIINQTGDTTLKRINDSLRFQIDSVYTPLVQENLNNKDSIIAVLGSRLNLSDSANMLLNDEVHNLKLASIACEMNFDNLHSETLKAEKALKKQTLWTKIWTGIGFVAGALLGHALK